MFYSQKASCSFCESCYTKFFSYTVSPLDQICTCPFWLGETENEQTTQTDTDWYTVTYHFDLVTKST